MKQKWEQLRKEISDNYDPPLHDPEFMLGLGLYWGEGFKYSTCTTGMASSDPYMLQKFLFWLQKFFTDDFEGLSVTVHHYSPQKDLQIKTYWSDILEISLEDFNKSQVLVSKSSRKKKGNILHYGTAKIVVKGQGNYMVQTKIQQALKMFTAL